MPDLSVMFAALDYSIVSTESLSEKSDSVSRMLCFKLCKIIVNKVTFIGFRGGAIAPIGSSGSVPGSDPLMLKSFIGRTAPC